MLIHSNFTRDQLEDLANNIFVIGREKIVLPKQLNL